MATTNNNDDERMAKLWAEETAAANEWETRETYKGYVVADLRKTFDKLCEPRD
jgi:hypothetical protein